VGRSFLRTHRSGVFEAGWPLLSSGRGITVIAAHAGPIPPHAAHFGRAASRISHLLARRQSSASVVMIQAGYGSRCCSAERVDFAGSEYHLQQCRRLLFRLAAL